MCEGRQSTECEVVLISVSDTAAADQPGLVVRKLQQCCVVFNFDDPLADVKSKEVKRASLNELITALNDTRGLLTEAVCIEVVHMVSDVRNPTCRCSTAACAEE